MANMIFNITCTENFRCKIELKRVRMSMYSDNDKNLHFMNKGDIKLVISVDGMKFNKYVELIGIMRHLEYDYEIKLFESFDINAENRNTDIVFDGIVVINMTRLTNLNENIQIDIR